VLRELPKITVPNVDPMLLTTAKFAAPVSGAFTVSAPVPPPPNRNVFSAGIRIVAELP